MACLRRVYNKARVRSDELSERIQERKAIALGFDRPERVHGMKVSPPIHSQARESMCHFIFHFAFDYTRCFLVLLLALCVLVIIYSPAGLAHSPFSSSASCGESCP